MSPLGKRLDHAVNLRQPKKFTSRKSVDLEVEASDVDIPPHSQIRDTESDESDENIISSPRERRNDPKWTPGSSYLQRKLQSSSTADDVAYRLRSRLVSRSGRETEVDKGQAETDSLSGSEHIGEITQSNVSPGKIKPALSHSYNLRSRIESTSSQTQE